MADMVKNINTVSSAVSDGTFSGPRDNYLNNSMGCFVRNGDVCQFSGSDFSMWPSMEMFFTGWVSVKLKY